jgi:hypothetical protein
MMHLRWVAVPMILTMIACDADPASKVKVIERPPRAVAIGHDSASASIYNWTPPPPFKPELCNVQPEKEKGQTTFVANGPCSFRHQANVKCRAALDDFHTVMLRYGPGEATVAVYLNIEFYKGAGNYEGGQMFLTVQDKSAYYHWGSDSVKTTVGPGIKYVDIPPTRLEAEPPNTGTVIVSGRLWCASLEEEKPQIIKINNG